MLLFLGCFGGVGVSGFFTPNIIYTVCPRIVLFIYLII